MSARAIKEGTYCGHSNNDISNSSIFVAILAASPGPGAWASPGPGADCCMAISYNTAASKSGGTWTPQPLASDSRQPVKRVGG